MKAILELELNTDHEIEVEWNGRWEDNSFTYDYGSITNAIERGCDYEIDEITALYVWIPIKGRNFKRRVNLDKISKKLYYLILDEILEYVDENPEEG